MSALINYYVGANVEWRRKMSSAVFYHRDEIDSFLFVSLYHYSHLTWAIINENRKYTLNGLCFLKLFYIVSSRAHTIVAIQFAQNEMKTKTTKQSVINLVDLAGRWVN